MILIPSGTSNSGRVRTIEIPETNSFFLKSASFSFSGRYRISVSLASDSVTSNEIASDSVGADELWVSGNGTSGQVLASDGDGSFSWSTIEAGGGFDSYQQFNSSGTWTKPAGIRYVKVEVIGGGGGGSGHGEGGGAGGYTARIMDVRGITSVAVTDRKSVV